MSGRLSGGGSLADQVYVVVTVDPVLAMITDVEVLDSRPTWEPLPGQVCYVANVNGGDSLEIDWPTR